MPVDAAASRSHSASDSAKLRNTQRSKCVSATPVDENVDVVDHRLRDAARREGGQIEVDRDVAASRTSTPSLAFEAQDRAAVREVGDGAVARGQRR